MPPSPQRSDNATGEVRLKWFAVSFGVFLGLTLLKFGTAVIMEGQIDWPRNGYEWVINSAWPVAMGYSLLTLVAVFGLLVIRRLPTRPGWVALLPLAWLGWQLLSATTTVDPSLTALTLKHFAACVVCFYLGVFALSQAGSLRGFWAMIGVGLLLVQASGFEQHFGGLARTREYLLKNEATHWRECPLEEVAQMERGGMLQRTAEGYTANPGLLKKAESSRISGTLFYPNSLAGALLLLVPAVLTTVVQTGRLTSGAKGLVGGLLGGGALACLFWSGSKAGWLLALVLALLALLRLPFDRRIKTGVLIAVAVLGLTGFTVKYAGFFKKGATSVVARFDYWHAAWQTALAKSMLGTGPGTFSRPYQLIKKPESEMARLTHNDYLQQASDSGWPGFALYVAFVAGVLVVSGRRVFADPNWETFTIWLGVLGWALQGFVEFGLYIPALAWPAFTLLGWLLASSGRVSSASGRQPDASVAPPPERSQHSRHPKHQRPNPAPKS